MKFHDVTWVAEIAPRLTDEEVLEIANREGRILVTNDKDFGKLVFLQRKVKSGFILMRLSTEDSSEKAHRLTGFLNRYRGNLTGRFVVVGDKRARVRTI